MNIKDKIIEWQSSFKDRCRSQEEELECDRDLELVLFVVDSLAGRVLPLDEMNHAVVETKNTREAFDKLIKGGFIVTQENDTAYVEADDIQQARKNLFGKDIKIRGES